MNSLLLAEKGFFSPIFICPEKSELKTSVNNRLSDSPIIEQIVLTIFGQCLTNGVDNRERTFFWTDLDKKSSLVENNSECTTKKMEEHYELKLRQNCKQKTKKIFGICATIQNTI